MLPCNTHAACFHHDWITNRLCSRLWKNFCNNILTKAGWCVTCKNNFPTDWLGAQCSYLHIGWKKGRTTWFMPATGCLVRAAHSSYLIKTTGNLKAWHVFALKNLTSKSPILLWTTSEGSAKMIPSLHSSTHHNVKTSKEFKMGLASQHSKCCA